MKKHILLFASKKSDVFQGIHDSFSAAAKDFKGKVLFVLVDSDVEDNSRISEFFGIDAKEIPTVRLINLEADDMTKYKPQTTELTTDNVKAFVRDVLDGKLKVDKLVCFYLWASRVKKKPGNEFVNFNSFRESQKKNTGLNGT